MSDKYISGDADNMGEKIVEAALDNNEKKLIAIGERIKEGHALVKKWVRKHRGRIIEQGGDEFMAALPKAPSEEEFIAFRKSYFDTVFATLSIGVGDSISLAMRARIMAKALGKNQVVRWEIKNDRSQVSIR